MNSAVVFSVLFLAHQICLGEELSPGSIYGGEIGALVCCSADSSNKSSLRSPSNFSTTTAINFSETLGGLIGEEMAQKLD